MEKDITLQERRTTKAKISKHPLTSTSAISSGELQVKRATKFALTDQHQSRWDSESTNTSELTEASGVPLTENPKRKKLRLPNHSGLEATTKKMTPLKTETNTSLLTTKQNSQKRKLLNWLASSQQQHLSSPKSYPSTPFLRWLIKCHQLCLLPLTFQQVYWPELLELEYPEGLQSRWDQPALSSDECWEENQVNYLLELPTCLEEMPEEFRLELHHLLAEAVVEVEEAVEEPLEEGEIYPSKYP